MTPDGKPFEVVSVTDSALDVLAMGDDYRKYAADRDIKLIKVKPGEKLTKFFIRDVSTTLMQTYCKAAASEADRWMRTFSVGCVRVENLVEKMTGNVRPSVGPTGTIAHHGGMISRWTDEDLDLLHDGYIDEIGSFIEARGGLPLGSGDSYRLPPSSLVVFLRRHQRLAESIQSGQLQFSETSKEAPESPPEGNGEKPTGALVTGSPNES